MASPKDYARFADLGYDDFRRMATDAQLTDNEKIGFPDSYRRGKDAEILLDIRRKLAVIDERGKVVLDVGPGCSELPRLIVELCRRQGHELLLVDSAEMLAHLPDESYIKKWPAFYPDCPELFEQYANRVNVMLVYSVFQYLFAESNVWRFLDRSLTLLAPGGQMLIGDIPNISKRKRFFASGSGAAFHRSFTGRNENPEVYFNRLEPDQVDDSVVMAIVQRARAAGYDAYVLPQATTLPMANRREDILVVRP